MRQRAKHVLLAGLGLALGGAALAFFIRQLRGQWADVWACLRAAKAACLVLALGLIGALYWFRVVRWRLFLSPVKRVGWRSATGATCIGFMANNTLPVRAGELIRAYLLHQKEGVAFGHSLASVGLARVFDLIGLSVVLLVAWVLLSFQVSGGRHVSPEAGGAPEPVDSARQEGELNGADAGDRTRRARESGRPLMERIWRRGLLLVAAALAGTFVLIGVAVFPGPFLKAAELCTRILPGGWRGPANGFFRSITEAMGFLKHPGAVALAVGCSAGVWMAQGLSNYAVCLALGVRMGLAGALLAAVVVSVAVALPQAPGYLGTFHLAALLAAQSFGVSEGPAGAFALLLWAVNVVPITLVGLGFLWWEGLSLRRLTAASRRIRREAGTAG